MARVQHRGAKQPPDALGGVIVVDRRTGIRDGDCAAGHSRSLFFVFASEWFRDAGERPGRRFRRLGLLGLAGLTKSLKPEGLETLLEVTK